MSLEISDFLSSDSSRAEKEGSLPLSPLSTRILPTRPYHWQQEADQSPFMLQKLETSSSGEVALHPFHGRFYQVLWITQGTGTYIGENECYGVCPNTLLFLAPLALHRLKTSSFLSGVVISFKADVLTLDQQYQQSLLSSLFHQRIQNLCVLLNDEEAGQVRHIFHQLEQEVHAQLPGKLAMVQACLWILLTTIGRLACLSEQPEKELPPLVHMFLRLVERHIHTKKQVSDFADMLAVTPGYLNQVVKHYLGKTAGEILRDEVLQQAKRMLMFSGTSVNEIARHFAFEDPSYFCRFFRRSTGQSPKAFQRAMQRIS